MSNTRKPGKKAEEVRSDAFGNHFFQLPPKGVSPATLMGQTHAQTMQEYLKPKKIAVVKEFEPSDSIVMGSLNKKYEDPYANYKALYTFYPEGTKHNPAPNHNPKKNNLVENAKKNKHAKEPSATLYSPFPKTPGR